MRSLIQIILHVEGFGLSWSDIVTWRHVVATRHTLQGIELYRTIIKECYRPAIFESTIPLASLARNPATDQTNHVWAEQSGSRDVDT